MTSDQKLQSIRGRREPLEIEQYNAELDVKLAEASRDENLLAEPQARLEEVTAKLAVLTTEEETVKAAPEAEPEKAEEADPQ